jgi:hypothetical protein
MTDNDPENLSLLLKKAKIREFGDGKIRLLLSGHETIIMLGKFHKFRFNLYYFLEKPQMLGFDASHSCFSLYFLFFLLTSIHFLIRIYCNYKRINTFPIITITPID